MYSDIICGILSVYLAFYLTFYIIYGILSGISLSPHLQESSQRLKARQAHWQEGVIQPAS